MYENKVRVKHLKKLLNKLYALKHEGNIQFVHKSGKRKTTIHCSMEKLEEYLSKLKEYTHRIYTCGKHNSYSKTDKDATFVRMKKGAMKTVS